MSEEQNHDLFDFMSSISQEMASEYERIQKRVTEDPGTAGDQGEENWATLLRDWLPSTYKIVTKGRILSHKGVASPQVDILVLKPSYPNKLLDKKVYLAAGVAAAFECKITLKSHDIKKTVKNCVEIKKLFPERKGSPYKELHAPIVYGLLAHSHTWKEEKSTPIENIESQLWDSDYEIIKHPREMLDLLCVADLATWVAGTTAFIGPHQVPNWEAMRKIYGSSGSATTAYIGHTPKTQSQKQYFSPVGTLISHLSQKLAWENIEARDLADYYRLTNIAGSGSGRMRRWDSDIYSSEIRQRVELGQLSYGKAWDEWSVAFM